jgi:branched-chain amino acid transport system substrate-binding protein
MSRRSVLALGAHAAGGGFAISRAARPLRIGVSLGLTGIYAAPALMQQRAYALWRDEVNARGGILGRAVELEIRDDRSDAAQSRAIYTDYTSPGGVDHVFGPYSSEITLQIVPIVTGAGFPLLAAGASSDAIWQKGHPGIFGMWTQASRYSQGMLNLGREAGLATIAVINADDAFSRECAEGTKKWAPFLKYKIVLDREFVKGRSDLSQIMREAREQGADLVVVAGHLAEAQNARRALRDLGWMPRAFYATVGPALPSWPAQLGIADDTSFSTSIWEPNAPFPRSREFAAAFRRRHGEDASYHAATAFAAGEVFQAAVLAAGKLDREAVLKALYGLDTYSVLGRFAVDRTGIQVKRLEMIVQWQDGQKKIVFPEDTRTALPLIGPAL